MSLYAQFKTNADLESKGVALDYGTNSKGEPIRIVVARAGGNNVRFSRLLESKVKPFRRQIQNDTLDDATRDRIMTEVYAEAVVLDWEGVEDEKGNHIPHSVANAVKLLTDLPELFRDIMEQANKLATFRDEQREADAKN